MNSYEREQLQTALFFLNKLAVSENIIDQSPPLTGYEKALREQQARAQLRLIKPGNQTVTLPMRDELRAETHIDNFTDKNMLAVADKEKNAMANLKIKGLVLGKKPRKDGRYMGRILIDGKYKCFYEPTYELLEKTAHEYVSGKRKPEKLAQLTVRDWVQKWLELYHRKKVSDVVFKNDSATFNNHVLPLIGNRPLHRLSGIEIQETINQCPYSRQRQIVANLLVACIRKAYQTDVIKKDITKAVEKPAHQIEGGRPLSREEERKLLDYLKGHELEGYMLLLINSGLRRNEALGLQWKHLDFESNNILVVQQVNINNEITPRLKTKTSRRILKMFPAIRKFFEPLKPADGEQRVFPYQPHYVSENFKKICAELNLKNSIKGTRTTFATRCAERGIADKVVQAWLGHSRLDTTVNVYQKTTNDFIEQEFKKIQVDFDTDLTQV